MLYTIVFSSIMFLWWWMPFPVGNLVSLSFFFLLWLILLRMMFSYFFYLRRQLWCVVVTLGNKFRSSRVATSYQMCFTKISLHHRGSEWKITASAAFHLQETSSRTIKNVSSDLRNRDMCATAIGKVLLVRVAHSQLMHLQVQVSSLCDLLA